MIVFSFDLMTFVCTVIIARRNGSGVGGSGSGKFSDEICGWFRDPPVVGGALSGRRRQGGAVNRAVQFRLCLDYYSYARDVETAGKC